MLFLQRGRLLPLRASGQVWLLSTRSAPLCGDLESGSAAISYWRLGPDRTWQAQTRPHSIVATIRPDRRSSSFTATASTPTTAVEYGCGLYRHIQETACGRPFRLVIWSWPSERIVRRNRPDAQLKAQWSDVQSYYLARFLGSIRPDVPVSLIGYSFGARVATGALQLLAGGQIACRSLPPAVVAERTAAGRRPYRLVLIAAAADADWLLPGCRDGLVLPLVDRVLVTANCCDPVLRWYPRLYGRGGPEAMGYVGPLMLCTARLVRQDRGDRPVVLGGPHPRLAHL